MIALRFEDHAGAGLAANRTARGQIGTMITRIDQAIAELSQKLGFHGSILGLTEIAAPDPALVRDDDQLVTVLFQPSQRFAPLREHLHLPRVAAVIDIAHERAVAVKKNGGPALVRRAGHFESSPLTLPALRWRCPLSRLRPRWRGSRSRLLPLASRRSRGPT